MSTFRSANSSRQSQSQIFTPIQKRQYTKPPQVMRQPIRKGTSVASSVYDTDEFQPTSRLTLKQAITLITLRLGKLEVFANDMKLTGSVPRGEDVAGVDKDFLLSIVSRLDNMEKMQHNLRIDIENIKNSIMDIHQALNEETDVVIDINDQPVIVDILNRLSVLDESMKKEPETIETETIENTISDNFPVYNPDIIEPYVIDSEVLQPSQPDIEVPEVAPTLSTPQFSTPQFSTSPSTAPLTTQEQNPKTPRKRGKKITII